MLISPEEELVIMLSSVSGDMASVMGVRGEGMRWWMYLLFDTTSTSARSNRRTGTAHDKRASSS
jgi:hypothetical protein